MPGTIYKNWYITGAPITPPPQASIPGYAWMPPPESQAFASLNGQIVASPVFSAFGNASNQWVDSQSTAVQPLTAAQQVAIDGMKQSIAPTPLPAVPAVPIAGTIPGTSLYKNWSLALVPGTTQYQAKALLNGQVLTSPAQPDWASMLRWVDAFAQPVQPYVAPYPTSQYAGSVMGTPQPMYPPQYAAPAYPGASPYNPAPMVDATNVKPGASAVDAPKAKKPLWKQPAFIAVAAVVAIGAFVLFRRRR